MQVAQDAVDSPAVALDAVDPAAGLLQLVLHVVRHDVRSADDGHAFGEGGLFRLEAEGRLEAEDVAQGDHQVGLRLRIPGGPEQDVVCEDLLQGALPRKAEGVAVQAVASTRPFLRMVGMEVEGGVAGEAGDLHTIDLAFDHGHAGAGFLGAGWDAPDGESGTMASQAAAFDLMGQWAPGAFANQAGLDDPADLPFTLGWAPFPGVAGGAGVASEGFGGVDGFVVAADAPPETVEFLKYIVSPDVQRQIGVDQPLPANRQAADIVTDPNQIAVFEGLSELTFLQQYLDQFFTPEVGGAINDQTAALFGGAVSPADAAAAITATAGG